MSLQPVYEHILIKPEKPKEESAGGIIIPDAVQKKQSRGVVLAVGKGEVLPDGSRVPWEVEEGDTIYFAKYGGVEVNHKEQKLVLLPRREILAVVKDEEETS